MLPGDLGPADAVILVDVQNDFCPGGALPVQEGDAVVPVLNRWIEAALASGAAVVASRDWHPPDHVSFAARGGPWPPHCVQGTGGAAFHPALALPPGAREIRKGQAPDLDQHSAFDGSELAAWLSSLGVRRVYVGGLALDVCVRATVLDALRAGFGATLIADATRPVDPASRGRVMGELAAAGAAIWEERAG